MQIAAFNENRFTLGHASVMINEGLPLYVVSKLERRYDLSSMTVGILGMAFKGGSDDIRSSLSYKLKHLLSIKARAVLCTDPYVTVDPDIRPLESVLASSDLRGGGYSPLAVCRAGGGGSGGRPLQHSRPRRPDLMPRVSIIVPVFNEGAEIIPFLDRVFEAVTIPCELLAVYDTPGDTTAPYLAEYAKREPRLRPVQNTYGRGPAAALRYGIDNAESLVVVVTMADGSDDPHQIDQLTRLVERGVVVAAASRYMRGGQQVGGPWVKGMMSRLAGWSLHLLARVGTHDATNSFKAYSRDFVREVGIQSDAGFTLGIEMVAKAKRHGLPVAEIPTIWLDRASGTSNFRVTRWMERYLRWYVRALRPSGKRPRPRPRP